MLLGPRNVVVAITVLFLLALGACSEDKKLKVTGLEPTRGDYQGGERVTIKGNRFTKDGQRAARVYFGGKPAKVLGFQGDDELVVQAPGGDADKKVDVLVIFEPGGEITLPAAFQFVQKEAAKVDDLHTGGKDGAK